MSNAFFDLIAERHERSMETSHSQESAFHIVQQTMDELAPSRYNGRQPASGTSTDQDGNQVYRVLWPNMLGSAMFDVQFRYEASPTTNRGVVHLEFLGGATSGKKLAGEKKLSELSNRVFAQLRKA